MTEINKEDLLDKLRAKQIHYRNEAGDGGSPEEDECFITSETYKEVIALVERL